MERFCSLETPYIQRVFLTLLFQLLLAFLQGWAEHRIAVAGQHDFPWPEVEWDDEHMKPVDGETIYHAIGDILLAHRLQHARNDNRSRCVVAEQLVLFNA